MKRTILTPISCFVVGLILATAGTASAEFIVNSQVLSDEVSAPGVSADNYVGDMSSVDAGVGGSAIGGSGQRRNFGQPDLFYNYYTQGYANRANAQMYLSPHPVPPNVGHTFYTYQPLYPHHYLYAHKDTYHNYYDNGRGMNRTRVNYSTSPVRTGASNIYWNLLRKPR